MGHEKLVLKKSPFGERWSQLWCCVPDGSDPRYASYALGIKYARLGTCRMPSAEFVVF